MNECLQERSRLHEARDNVRQERDSLQEQVVLLIRDKGALTAELDSLRRQKDSMLLDMTEKVQEMDRYGLPQATEGLHAARDDGEGSGN
jgi:hypothetical protein